MTRIKDTDIQKRAAQYLAAANGLPAAQALQQAEDLLHIVRTMDGGEDISIPAPQRAQCERAQGRWTGAAEH